MMKNWFILILTSLLISCGTGSNVSEVRVPPSKSAETEIKESKTDSTLQSYESMIDSTELANFSETESEDSTTTMIAEEAEISKTDEAKTAIENPAKEIETPVVVKKTEPVKVTVTPKANTTKSPESKKSFNYRNFNRDAQRTGEKLTFNINYLAITAGEATMSVTDEFNYNNRLVQKIVFEANSSRSYSWIYKVEDKYISYLDKIGIYPWKFSKEINEGSFHAKEDVIFDHIKEEAREGEKITKIPPYTHDIISAFYFVRNNDLSNMKPGDVIKLSNYSSGKIHPLDVRFKGWQQIKVPAGTFNCVVLEPLVKAGGLFKDEGTLVIWLTNDELKIPVKVETKVVIGSINVELKKIEGVNRPIPAKVN